jgi:hypothetical protein
MKISKTFVCTEAGKADDKRSCNVVFGRIVSEEESPECTSSPDGIEQVRKDDMIERAIGIDFIKQFKQPPITDDTLTDCESMRILH